MVRFERLFQFLQVHQSALSAQQSARSEATHVLDPLDSVRRDEDVRLVKVCDNEAMPACLLVELQEDLLDGGVAGERGVSQRDGCDSRGGTHQVTRTPGQP